jgi:hypothetical protein
MCLITDSRHLMMQSQLLLSPRGFASVGGSKKEISVRKWKVTIRSAGSSNISQTLFCLLMSLNTFTYNVDQLVTHTQLLKTCHARKKGGQFTHTWNFFNFLLLVFFSKCFLFVNLKIEDGGKKCEERRNRCVAVLYAISTQTEPTLAFTTRQDAGAHHGPLAETPVSHPPFLGDQPIILLPCSLYLYLDIDIHHFDGNT